MMVIYEVSVEIIPEIKVAFFPWLCEHVKKMLTFEGFDCAQILEKQSEISSYHLVVSYQVATMSHLQNYFDTDADKMRQSGIDAFGSQFTATRRILQPLKSYTSD